jgi:hypothetical protein
MDVKREQGKFAWLAVWVCLLSCNDPAVAEDIPAGETGTDYPPDQEVRWNTNAALAIGADGVAYVSRFETWAPGSSSPGHGSCSPWIERIDSEGTPQGRDPTFRHELRDCDMPVLVTRNDDLITAHAGRIEVHAGFPSSVIREIWEVAWPIHAWVDTPDGYILVGWRHAGASVVSSIDPLDPMHFETLSVDVDERVGSLIAGDDGGWTVAGWGEPIVEQFSGDGISMWRFVGPQGYRVVDMAPAPDRDVYVAMEGSGTPRPFTVVRLGAGGVDPRFELTSEAPAGAGILALASNDGAVCILEVVSSDEGSDTQVSCHGHDASLRWRWSARGYGRPVDLEWTSSWLQRTAEGDTVAIVPRVGVVRFDPDGAVRWIVELE